MENLERGFGNLLGECAQAIIKKASEEVRSREHENLMPEHLLKAIAEMDAPLFDRAVRGLNLEPTAVVQRLDVKLAMPQNTSTGTCTIKARVNGVEVPTYPAPCAHVMHAALVEAQKQGHRLIESKDILTALCQGPSSIVHELMGLPRPGAETDLLAKKIVEFLTRQPAARGTEELTRILEETSEEVRLAALQKAAAQAQPQFPHNVLHCSFCGKTQHKVKKLIAGPSVYICNECIDICTEIIADDRRSER